MTGLSFRTRERNQARNRTRYQRIKNLPPAERALTSMTDEQRDERLRLPLLKCQGGPGYNQSHFSGD